MKLSTSILAIFAAQTIVAAPIDTTPTLAKRFDINALLADLLAIFPLNVIVNDLQDFITGSLQDVANGLGIQTTQNAGTACATVTILYARGTNEPGNVGVIVLPAFEDAVQSKVKGSVAVQGTNNCNHDNAYPSMCISSSLTVRLDAATIDGFLEGGDQQGSQQL